MGWVYLGIAGLLEIAWAVALKKADGFTQLWPSVVAVVLMIASFFFLAQAVRTIPLGTGYAIASSDGVARCVITNGTVIAPYGHWLCDNSLGYSLASYPAGNGTTATGDATYTGDIPDNAGIALFNPSVAVDFTLGNRIDAVGSTSEANTLYKEGTGYPALTPFSIDYSFYRNLSTSDIATPVFYKNRIYVSTGQDPEHGEGVGHFLCMDATKTGDITKSGMIWEYKGIHRTISTCSIDPNTGLLFIGDFSGFVHCLDADELEGCRAHSREVRLIRRDEDVDVVRRANQSVMRHRITVDHQEAHPMAP